MRLVEGAGGVAVSLEGSGKDIANLAQTIKADFILIVVGKRLGAINQARLTSEYVSKTGIPYAVWLNEVVETTDHVKHSN